MSGPIPVVVCGQQAVILKDVKERLLPEYESTSTPPNPAKPIPTNSQVIHGILHPSPGPSELPALLRGEKPNDPDNIGTKDYSKSPAAIMLNAGYEDDAVNEMHEACKGAAGGLGMPCLRFDELKPVDVPMGPEYGEVLVARVKDLMKKLAEEGKMGEDGVHFY